MAALFLSQVTHYCANDDQALVVFRSATPIFPEETQHLYLERK